MRANRTTIAGIAVPDSALAREATALVQEVATQLLFDHSRRVFLWGALQGERLGLRYDPELLYVGAVFHDVGLLEGHCSEDERYTTQYDVLGMHFDALSEKQRSAVLSVHPRTGFKTGIIEAFAAGIRDAPFEA
jgi:hypothetical protein